MSVIRIGQAMRSLAAIGLFFICAIVFGVRMLSGFTPQPQTVVAYCRQPTLNASRDGTAYPDLAAANTSRYPNSSSSGSATENARMSQVAITNSVLHISGKRVKLEILALMLRLRLPLIVH